MKLTAQGIYALILGMALLAGFASDAEGQAAATAEDWQVLFDGTQESLQANWTGFRMDNIPEAWHVEDGVLALSSSEGHGGGHLMTKEQFGNFILEMEWKLNEGGNSGIFYRVTEEESAPEYTGPELQVVAGEGAGGNFDMHDPTANAVKPAGEWNKVRIVARGDHVEHWLNGEKVVEYELGSEAWEQLKAESKFAELPYGQAERGHVVLQDHGDDVRYRDVRIQPATNSAEVQIPMTSHSNTAGPEWKPLFTDLSEAIAPAGVWSWEGDSLLTATEDEAIFTEEEYDDYVLDLEVKFDPGANSGIIVHASDTDDWIPNSLEIQIGDSYSPASAAEAPTNTEAGSMFGHVAPSEQMIKAPGEWNRFTVTARNDSLWLVLNGEPVSKIDMSEYTSAETNPDGTEIPEWLSTPLAELPTEGHIGLQGKHGESAVWFRNIKIRRLD